MNSGVYSAPNEAKNLHTSHGKSFEALYEKYEREGKAKRTFPARELWNAMAWVYKG